MTLRWNPALATQIAVIDRDHQNLIQIVNDLYEGVQLGCSRRIIGRILSRLIDHADEHFRREEQVMRHFSFLKLESHIRQHLDLLDRLGRVVFEFEMANDAVTLHTIDLLRDWVEVHLARDDAEFSYFLSGRSIPAGLMGEAALTWRSHAMTG